VGFLGHFCAAFSPSMRRVLFLAIRQHAATFRLTDTSRVSRSTNGDIFVQQS
jgi:hypothetical protein